MYNMFIFIYNVYIDVTSKTLEEMMEIYGLNNKQREHIAKLQNSDGKADHVGIVEKVENDTVYTIEGNTRGDMCKENQYKINSSVILGYGTPEYNKKYVLISGTVIFTVGASIAYVIINGIATAFVVALSWIFRYM